MTETLFKEEDVIYSYSSEQAEQDGFLIAVDNLFKRKGLFNYITRGLWDKYGIEESQNKIPCLIDLLNQAVQIVKRKEKDTFYSGNIKGTDAQTIKIFIEQNETGRFTLLLPEEH